MNNKLLVVGDVMLDRYIEGHIHRISPEAPVPIVAIESESARLGGAGNVAASLAGLGCAVMLACILGDDPEGEMLRTELAHAGIDPSAVVFGANLRTICKTRVLAGGRQQVLRLDRDSCRNTIERASEELREAVLARICDQNAVVVSDYDKGTIPSRFAGAIVAECRRAGVPCIVDSKKPSFIDYHGATLLTPNVREAMQALRWSSDDDMTIRTGAAAARESLGLDYLLVTKGSNGMTLASEKGLTEFPAEVREVADVTGAGDTVTAVVAAGLAAGQEISAACRLASTAAGIAVSHRGCYIVGSAELNAAANGQPLKMRDWAEAERWADTQRRNGHKVVFTNGCFDILHAGHLSCLQRAKRLGDVLVVGLNSDVSVRMNKGTSRPIIPERERATLLAGLSCVDMIVIFDDMTPERLVQTVKPDILVKGADYSADLIAGATFVRESGGEVVILPLLDGLSTTRIVNAARGNAD